MSPFHYPRRNIMFTLKRPMIVIACALLLASTVAAQNLQQEARSAAAGSQSVTIIIERQQLRFAGPVSAQEVKLEVFNQAGEMVYDSGFVSGAELSWALRNTSGEAVPSGLYAYPLTVKDANSETPALRRGNLIVERGRDREPQTDRLWVTSQDAIGAEAAISGGELTASSGPETSVVGTRIGRSVASKGSPINLQSFGTAGQIAKFGGGGCLGM